MIEHTSADATGGKLAGLTGTYPDAKDVLDAASEGKRQRSVLARLWISEGIPFAFKDSPSQYEKFRTILATRLKIDAKEISIQGSGRLGYSMKPGREWGRQYNRVHSDLDWFAVSQCLFHRFCKDFESWRDDYQDGKIQPMERESGDRWDNNRDEVPENIKNGLIDSWRVPNRKEYVTFSSTNSCLGYLRRILIPDEEELQKSKRWSLRCFRDWKAFDRQMRINLNNAVPKGH